jgi:hypothetical protein
LGRLGKRPNPAENGAESIVKAVARAVKPAVRSVRPAEGVAKAVERIVKANSISETNGASAVKAGAIRKTYGECAENAAGRFVKEFGSIVIRFEGGLRIGIEKVGRRNIRKTDFILARKYTIQHDCCSVR